MVCFKIIFLFLIQKYGFLNDLLGGTFLSLKMTAKLLTLPGMLKEKKRMYILI